MTLMVMVIAAQRLHDRQGCPQGRTSACSPCDRTPSLPLTSSPRGPHALRIVLAAGCRLLPGLRALGEGVEAVARLAGLQAMRCAEVQGCFIVRAMPAGTVPRVLSQGSFFDPVHPAVRRTVTTRPANRCGAAGTSAAASPRMTMRQRLSRLRATRRPTNS